MTDDALDRYRRLVDPAKLPQPRPSLAASRMPYVPFIARDKITRLTLRAGKSGQAYCLMYPHITIVGYNWLTHTQLVLTTPGLVVIVRGARFAPIEEAVGLHSCELIQQYDAELFTAPDETAPLVENIEFRIMHGIDPAQPPGEAA